MAILPETTVLNCPHCGSEMGTGHRFCPACGEPVVDEKICVRPGSVEGEQPMTEGPGKTVLPKAGLFRRVLADIIDRWVPCPFFAYLFPPWILAVIGYGLLCDGLMEGRSVGKRLLGLRTLDCDRLEPCTYSRSFLRNLSWTLAQVAYTSLFLIPLAMAYDFLELLFIAFDQQGRRLGDRIGGTVVVTESSFRCR